jgi:hypothetical protein
MTPDSAAGACAVLVAERVAVTRTHWGGPEWWPGTVRHVLYALRLGNTTVHGGSLIESGLTAYVPVQRGYLPVPCHNTPTGTGVLSVNVCASYSPSVPLQSDVIDDYLLVVSELATNAVQAGCTAVQHLPWRFIVTIFGSPLTTMARRATTGRRHVAPTIEAAGDCQSSIPCHVRGG